MKVLSKVRYALQPGDQVTVKVMGCAEWDTKEQSFSNQGGYYTERFVVATAHKNHVCNHCFETIPKGSKYLGWEAWKQNYPKFCQKCALELFSDHALDEFVFVKGVPFDQQVQVLRQVNISQVFNGKKKETA